MVPKNHSLSILGGALAAEPWSRDGVQGSLQQPTLTPLVQRFCVLSGLLILACCSPANPHNLFLEPSGTGRIGNLLVFGGELSSRPKQLSSIAFVYIDFASSRDMSSVFHMRSNRLNPGDWSWSVSFGAGNAGVDIRITASSEDAHIRVGEQSFDLREGNHFVLKSRDGSFSLERVGQLGVVWASDIDNAEAYKRFRSLGFK